MYTVKQVEEQATWMERDHGNATAIAMLRQAAQMMRESTVVTGNTDGEIVAVTRQDEDHHILEVIADRRSRSAGLQRK